MTTEVELFNALKYRVTVSPVTGTRRYYNNKHQLHRDEGPAVEYADGTKKWYQNGVLHREDGPAVVWYDGDEAWWFNGVKCTVTAESLRREAQNDH